MYPIVSPAFELKRRTASDVIPGWVIGLLASLQLVLWLAIIILEGVIVYYNATQGTVFADFWCSAIFFITWVSMFCFLCCTRTNCCGNYIVVMSSIALCFSIVLVAFTIIFVNNPCKCYGPFCDIIAWATCRLLSMRKLPYLRGLLACAALMLLSNLVYLVTFISFSIWLCKRGNDDMEKMNAMYQKQAESVDFEHQQKYPRTPRNYSPKINGRPYPAYPMNAGYRQPLSKTPVSQWQPAQDDYGDNEHF